MAQPVWVLSVDLQTKTATFQSGLGDAARAARGSFTEIKEGARKMGAETNYSMTEARHGVMLLGEEFGVHIPRALTSFLAGLGPIGEAMEAAFPFLAIAVGATLLIEHLVKMREEGEKLTENQLKFGTAVQNAFNDLDKKLLEAGIRADDLNGNHLAALQKQLELIDHASMEELVKSFDLVAKSADVVFGELKSHWYTMGIGSSGAQHALTQFKTEYEGLLAAGKDKEASDLLSGTRQSAEHVLGSMNGIRAMLNQARGGEQVVSHSDYQRKYTEALNDLKKAGVGFTDKEVQAQKILVDALKDQVTIEGKVAQLKAVQGSNARQGTANKIGGDEEKALRERADAERRGLEEAEKLREAAYRSALDKLQQNEREKIEATEKGSAARLAAINAAIKEEDSKGLQETGFYRGLLIQRVELLRQMTEEQNKLTAEAGKDEAENFLKMGELAVTAEREKEQLRRSLVRVSDAERLAGDIQFANEEYSIKMAAYSKEIAALDKNGKNVENKVKAIQNKEEELTRQHENQITQIKDKAAKEQQQKQQQALNRMEQGFAQSALSVLQGHRSFAQTMGSLSEQIATNTLAAAIAEKNGLESTKLTEAKAAARKMYLAGTHFPFPTNIVMAPALGAIGFAAMMAFHDGGIVPGTGKGDIVPAMLEPGEGVVPKAVMDAARTGGTDNSRGPDIHVHHHASYHISAIDGASVREMLAKHSDEFAKHATNTIRKMNRG